jgi:hypothetical protein
MYRLLLILSLAPLVVALLSRWWFGLRVLAIEGTRACRCDLTRWFPPDSGKDGVQRAEASAGDFGRNLREMALADWKQSDPSAASAREGMRRFGMAVPPLSAVVAIFAMVVGKIPLAGVLAILLGATALAAVFGLLTLPAELQAIQRAARKAREQGGFPDADDHATVLRCAVAHAWVAAVPPILNLLQPAPVKRA